MQVHWMMTYNCTILYQISGQMASLKGMAGVCHCIQILVISLEMEEGDVEVTCKLTRLGKRSRAGDKGPRKSETRSPFILIRFHN